ncbi:MAG: type II toxin-antitoxin system RelE/ParE family toxin [Chloroflexi bacterium]|nr:type II toxin-antitoxin system RelE/ParE family toxin [Chloroflexota bacterium]
MDYSVRLNRAAQRELDRLNSRIRRQVLERILKLGDDPRPQDVKLLRGRNHSYRVASGEYRILYEIDDASKVVLIFRVGNRREVYRNL